MALTDLSIKSLKPQGKPYKVADGGGLFLLVKPNGSKLWRFRYSFAGKEKSISPGPYPLVGLRDARGKRDDYRRQLADSVDPGALRQSRKAMETNSGESSFEAVAREWFVKFSKDWAPSHSEKILSRLQRDVFPWIGTRNFDEIDAPLLLTVLRRIECRGALETAHRVHQNCGQVFRYAIATGRAVRDPSPDLRGALAPWRPQHYPSITEPEAVGQLLRDIHEYKGSFVTGCAMRLAPLLFVRPGELRRAEWSEINLDEAEWRIPAEKMKSRTQHIVPLSTQSVSVLQELRALTGRGQYVFPGRRSPREPMSENTVNAALRRIGYAKEEFTAHGFRSMASTLLNEQGWNRDAIERQLAHGEKDQVRAAYNYAEHLPMRRQMMQAWADYLDSLRDNHRMFSSGVSNLTAEPGGLNQRARLPQVEQIESAQLDEQFHEHFKRVMRNFPWKSGIQSKPSQ